VDYLAMPDHDLENRWKEMNRPQPVAIELTRKKLDEVIANILAVGSFIEGHLPATMC